MEEEQVSYEVSKLAKEKGFDGPAYTYFYTDEYFKKLGNKKYDHSTLDPIRNGNINKKMIECVCPTQSILRRFLREIKDIEIVITPIVGDSIDKKMYSAHVYIFNTPIYRQCQRVDSYEEALELGLLEGLKLIN